MDKLHVVDAISTKWDKFSEASGCALRIFVCLLLVALPDVAAKEVGNGICAYSCSARD